MKLVEINENVLKDDLLTFNGEKIEGISKHKLLEEVESLKEELKKTKKELTDFKKLVNNKLKEYHKVLQLLSKGGK